MFLIISLLDIFSEYIPLFNCYFLYVGNLFTEKQIQRLEDANATILKKGEIDWQIDDNFLQHFKELGLEPGDDYQEGDEFISKV